MEGRVKFMNHDFNDICNQFKFFGKFNSIIPYGDGHINDTYKVTYTDSNEEFINYILQRINDTIFSNVNHLMENIENVTNYLNDMVIESDLPNGYEVLTLVSTIHGSKYYVDDHGNYWRAYIFVEGATGHTFAKSTHMLYEAARAFGQFQMMLNDFPVSCLHETLENFHQTPTRYCNLVESVEMDKMNRFQECFEQIAFVYNRSELICTIADALSSGKIPFRVTHNDTKINNVLLDDESGIGRCVIDLDTVMPGSALYDYGDAIRSCGSTETEDSENLENLTLDFDRFTSFTKGYLETMGLSLLEGEISLLPKAAIIMTLECGIRFLTDYLNGDKYFKVHKPKHNLIRAKNQFKFVTELELNYEKMQGFIYNYMSVIKSGVESK